MASGKIFVVPFLGERHLVRALTRRGAGRGLVNHMCENAIADAHEATQDELLELASSGQRVIDVTKDPDAADGGETAQPPAGDPGSAQGNE